MIYHSQVKLCRGYKRARIKDSLNLLLRWKNMNENMPIYVDSLGNIWHHELSPLNEANDVITSDYTESDAFEEFENESNFYF